MSGTDGAGPLGARARPRNPASAPLREELGGRQRHSNPGTAHWGVETRMRPGRSAGQGVRRRAPGRREAGRHRRPERSAGPKGKRPEQGAGLKGGQPGAECGAKGEVAWRGVPG